MILDFIVFIDIYIYTYISGSSACIITEYAAAALNEEYSLTYCTGN